MTSFVSIISTFVVFLTMGCGIINYLPIRTTEGAIIYLTSVLGTLMIWIGKKL